VSRKDTAENVKGRTLKRLLKELDSALCGVRIPKQRFAFRIVELKVAAETCEQP
jgi:hypothetical protein